jgi:cupin 2 domain-containing protein
MNLLESVSADLPDELFETVAESGNVRIERIISNGQATPSGEWCDQEWDEWVLLLSGSAGLLIEGEKNPRMMKSGDCQMIRAHCRHRVEWTDKNKPTVWLAVHVFR